MLKRIFQLFKIARKLSTSGAVETINQIYVLPLPVSLFFNIFSIGSSSTPIDKQRKPGEKLCTALQGMGTTFIKLGQFFDIVHRSVLHSKLDLSTPQNTTRDGILGVTCFDYLFF